jgi:hypothetical protein
VKYEVRLARPADNDTLCNLAARTPMVAGVSVSADRKPDFFAFYRQHGRELGEGDTPGNDDAWQAAVASCDGRVVCVVAVALRTVRWGDRQIRMAYPMDARVDPEYQRTGALRAAWALLQKTVDRAEIDLMVGLILRGNERARRFAMQVFPGKTPEERGDFHLVHFAMYWPYREPALDVERATDDDRDEIAALLARTWSRHLLSPRMDSAWLDRVFETSPGYATDDVRVVRRDGRIVALLGLWDPSPVRRLIVRKNPAAIRLGLLAAHALHKIIPSPPVPELGAPMRTLFIKHVACGPGHEDTLRGLMRITLNEVRKTRAIHVVWGGFYFNDPLLPLWREFKTTRSRSTLLFSPWSERVDYPPDPRTPVWADFSTV